MFDKVLNLIKSKDILVPRLLLLNYKSFNITDSELIVLIYLLNTNTIYNPKEISDDLKIELMEVLTIINNLTEKGIIKIDMKESQGKKIEVINLSLLYEKLSFLIINEEKEEDNSIYSMFEHEFARSLSPVEYDIINAWRDNGFTDELISLALKEAIYNGVNSLKYIDKILDGWNRRGIKNKADVIKDNQKFKEQKNKKVNKEVFTYDWLNDEE